MLSAIFKHGLGFCQMCLVFYYIRWPNTGFFFLTKSLAILVSSLEKQTPTVASNEVLTVICKHNLPVAAWISNYFTYWFITVDRWHISSHSHCPFYFVNYLPSPLRPSPAPGTEQKCLDRVSRLCREVFVWAEPSTEQNMIPRWGLSY